MTPDILLVGHIVKDLVNDSWQPSGSILFAAQQSKRLGLKVGAVAACSLDINPASFVPDITWVITEDSASVSFQNTYTDGQRLQRVFGQASVLNLADIPEAWHEARLILLAPLFHDLDPSLPKQLAGPKRLIGCIAQGWLRSQQEGNIRPVAVPSNPDWAGCDVVFLSEEDVANPDAAEDWRTQFPVVVLTRSERGSTIWAEAKRHDLPALPAAAVDPTGAGDVFATAFLIEYSKTHDAVGAGRFAAAAAALSVEGSDLHAIGGHSEIEARLTAEPVVRP